MELSPDGKDPRYHRKSVQAEGLGITLALAAALRIVQERHPNYRFEVVDAGVALEAGWALKGSEVRSRENTLPSGLLMATALASNSGIDMRILDPVTVCSSCPKSAHHR
jgi:hypothetical protein